MPLHLKTHRFNFELSIQAYLQTHQIHHLVNKDSTISVGCTIFAESVLRSGPEQLRVTQITVCLQHKQSYHLTFALMKRETVLLS